MTNRDEQQSEITGGPSGDDPYADLYTGARPFCAEDRATQIRHLSLIGIAAQGSDSFLRDLPAAYHSLFEVIHRLAGEIEGEEIGRGAQRWEGRA